MNFFFVTLFGFFLAVQASPLLFAPRADLDVFDPQIMTPKDDTVWCIGHTETVEWETDNAPQNISNGASIYLHHPDESILAVLLAKDFSLRSGSQDVFVPSNITPGQYKITLFGDSGNDSMLFQVVSCAGGDQKA